MPASSSKRRVNTVAKLNAAVCQNHTLVKQKPTPSPSRPTKLSSMAGTTMLHAFQ